jgi:hypothetical protein
VNGEHSSSHLGRSYIQHDLACKNQTDCTLFYSKYWSWNMKLKDQYITVFLSNCYIFIRKNNITKVLDKGTGFLTISIYSVCPATLMNWHNFHTLWGMGYSYGIMLKPSPHVATELMALVSLACLSNPNL